MRSAINILIPPVVAVAMVASWWLISSAALISPIYFPSPELTLNALLRGLRQGDLLSQFAATTARMLVGWLIASIIGIALGSIIGMSHRARVFLTPTLELLRPLPASAVIPLAIAFLGLSENMVLAVIAFGAVWPMLLATVQGFAAVEPRLYEVSRILKTPALSVIFKIALPSALPDILSGLRISMNVALILTIVGEMLAGSSGIGQWILYSARSFQTSNVFAGVILIGLLGFTTTKLLEMLEDKFLVWQAR
jgi:sulfonate transport system permease protein